MRSLTLLLSPVALSLGLALPATALAATPAGATPTPATRAATFAAPASAPPAKGRAITLPILGTGRSLKVEYAGPVAPWKVLNPFRHDERASTLTLVGARSSHELSMNTSLGKSGRAGHLGYASTQSHDGGATTSRRVALNAGPTSATSSERSVLAEQVRVDPNADRRVVQRLAQTSTSTRTPAGDRAKVDRLEVVDERANGHTGVTNKGAIALERVRADGRDDVSMRAGQTRVDAHGDTKTEGVVVRRDQDGNVSTQILRGGPERVRTMTHTLDPESRPRRNVFGRLKDAVIGTKKGPGFDENGLPEQR